QAEETPNNIAVVFENNELSYKELNEKANQLAHYLRDNYAIKPNDLIAIKVDRSDMMMVAILGILKSGAAYVPIDINYPQERIAYIETNSSSIAVVDEQLLKEFNGLQENYSKNNIDKINTSHDLAYVIYTSGTTGNPKGVMVEHFSVISIFENWKTHYGLDQIEVNLLQLASISFDVFVGDICRSILNGGKMIICSNDVKLNPEHLYELMQKQKISILEGTPSLLLPLMEYIIVENKDYSFFKILIFGSDSFNNQDYNSLKDKLGKDIKIINSYGVTEATIDSTFYDDYKDDLNGFTPIGKPFSNTKIRILDSFNNLVPVGVYGELFIGGDALARGYFNNEDLTAERFVRNPFETDEKLYKTGDLGRWLPDGNIDFIGRGDNQVKIRGYRIELGEIETVLSKNKDIVSCVVLARNDLSGEKCLVAYVVGKTELKVADLISYLKNVVPNYMIPSYFIQLEALPITPNGKVDRKALPDPQESSINSQVEYEAPSNEAENKLALIWQEILGIEKVGINDNFFELGGHSLKVTKLLYNINKEFDVKINFQSLFSSMIFREQIEIIAAARKEVYKNIPQIAKQASYILSSSQRRLWLLSQFEGGNKAYNMPSIFELKGNLIISSLEKAFFDLIERHESLRTVFKENEYSEIRQFVLDFEDHNFQLKYEEIKEESSAEKIERIIQNEIEVSFDLSSDSLIRAKIIKTSKDNYLFVCVMHHIISDGWSAEVITNELFTLYDNEVHKNQNALPVLKLQYKDYAAWQQEQLTNDTTDKSKAYWLKQFEGELPILDLPVYQVRPAIKTYAGNSINKVYDEKLLKDFGDLCQLQGSTLFMGLVTAVKILLHKYTNQTDIIIGSPIAGREHADLQHQIGFYVNTLALRTKFYPDYSFLDLLKNTKKVTLGAYEHQIYPFDELVESLTIKRDMSRNPLFDVMVTFQNTDNLKVNIETLGNLVINDYKGIKNDISKVDIEFIFEATTVGIQLILVYNTDLYTEAFATNITNHLEVLLQSIVTQPKVTLRELDYLKQEELHKLLLDFNDTNVSYSSEHTFIDLFEEAVNTFPEKQALKDDFRSFSYSELHKLSNQIAAYITANFIEQDKSPIAVLLDRSAYMVAILLGIMKTGRAYIPLDPTFPKERLDFIVANSGCKILINEKNYELEKIENLKVISIESILEQTDQLDGDLKLKVTPDHTAYIIYTSGSTGNPKGVEIGHKSLLNFLLSMKNKPGFGPEDTLFSVTTYSFDISILEFFAPLISGSGLYIAIQDVLSDPNLIIQRLNEIQPTIIQATPSFYQLLFNAEWQGNKNLKILCGGDLLSKSLTEKLLSNTLEVWNMYGPTETTIWSSTKKINFPDESSNIGKPIQNTQFYILDSFLKPKPVGTVGTIYIGGDGLAKGYYKNSSLTDQKFIKNPFSNGGFIYDTGDVGKWNTKGEIEFLGRNDNQVKIRGYRIELGDIESALFKISAIDAAVATVKTDDQGNKFLVGYLTSKEKLDVTDLKFRLKDFLPDYMIPAYFVQLQAMPLTPNGKIDRASLPNPDNLKITSSVEYEAPRDEVETKLVQIWSEVLNIETIGINDNFFELGGNSLSATRLISLIHKQFLVKISINDLFKNIIVEEQAILIRNILLTATLENNEDINDIEIETFTL
ncbi:non-ribosomal peptide synthetase, partial [Flavobacterium sp. Leaf82]|uniref:non-ribosomal peptide synthetase n=2 Tax=unclassified Flavobacterium TaxID=196869 RepID=UPI000AE27AA1